MDKSIFATDEIRKLAIKNFGKFIQVIKKLFFDKSIKFDLIVGGGDSGLGMVKFVELIYQELGLSVPRTIVIPIVRFKDPKIFWAESDAFYFDNSALLPEVKNQLKGVQKVENILFVDDEISSKGSTFLTCLKLITDALGQKISHPLNCYIVAEDFGYKAKSFDSNIRINFLPFSKGIPEIYSVVSYIVPWEIEKQIKEKFTEEQLNSKRRLNLLLGLPAKERVNDKGEYQYKYLNLANKRIKNFSKLQAQFLTYLKQLIKNNLNKVTF